MNIAFIIPSNRNKGPNIFVKNLTEALCKQNLNIDIFYFKHVDNELTFNNYKLIKFFGKESLTDYDIVCTTMLKPDLYALYKRKRIKNHVVGIHNFIKEDLAFNYKFPKNILLYYLWRFALKYSDYLICSSNYQAVYYQELLSQKKIFIIPYGLPERKEDNKKCDIKQKYSSFFDGDNVIIGSCGNLIRRKGFHDIINSLLLLPSNFKLVLIGSGDYGLHLHKLVDQNHLENRVLFIPETKLYYQYYEYFDVYCHASYSEGFGLALIEAFQRSIPCAITDLDIYQESIPNKYVQKFPVGNSLKIARSIKHLYLNHESYKILSRELFEKSFFINNTASSHFDIFSDILTKS